MIRAAAERQVKRMMKRFCALALVLVLACAAAFTCFADSNASVVYDGKNLTTSGSMDAINDLLPGVPSEDSMTITNNSGALTRFYIDTDVTKTLEGTYSSGYTVKLWVVNPDGSETVLFGNGAGSAEGSQVGGGMNANEGNQELKELNNVMGGYMLATTLGAGQRATLKLSITPDGAATTNEYMNKIGNINFRFMAEEVETLVRHEVNTVKSEPTVVTQTRYILTGVQTGDPMVIAPLVAVLALAVLVFVVVAAKKKSKKEE